MATGNVIRSGITGDWATVSVGGPNQNGAFFDGARHWLFWSEWDSDTETYGLRYAHGASLANMTVPDGFLITNLSYNGRSFGCLYGRVDGDWYVWIGTNQAVSGANQPTRNLDRWRLTSSGLDDRITYTSSVANRAATWHTLHSAWKGVADPLEVTQLWYCVQARGGDNQENSTAYNDLHVPDFATGPDVFGGHTWSKLNYPEMAHFFQLDDGHVTVAVDQGDSLGAPQPGGQEVTRVNLQASYVESEELGMTDQIYKTQLNGQAVTHTGYMDMCQLADGTIFLGYVNDDSLYHGRLHLWRRGNTIDSGWTDLGLPLDDQMWHVAMASDGVDFWLVYLPHDSAEDDRGRAIWARKYTVATGGFGPARKVADIRSGYRFERMYAGSHRFYRNRIVVVWSETSDDETYDVLAASHVATKYVMVRRSS